MKVNSVCLIQLPSEDALFGAVGAKLPPLALGIITGHLRGRGVNVDQFDLMPRMEEVYGLVKDRSPFEAFFDKERVFAYVQGGTNLFFEEFVEKLLRGIPVDKYDLIAFSVGPHLSWIQTHAGLIFGEYIQRRWQKTMCFGGINLNTMVPYSPVYDELFELWLKKFTYVIHGPGEESLYQLIQALQAEKSEVEIHQIKGMCFLDENGRVLFNPSEKRRIIKPAFEGLQLEDYYNYVKKDGHGENLIALYRYPFAFTKPLRCSGVKNDEYETRLVIPYVFNYNCPYSCAFCVESNPDAPFPVIGSVEQVVRDLEEMKATYDTPYFYFINNAVNCSKKYIKSLCREIIERDLEIYWSDCARFDNVDYEILSMMKQAGCQKLVFGMESGSQALTKRINKQIDLRYAEQVMAWCSEIGIWAELEIILGMPTETEDNFLENYSYLKQNLKHINFMTINHYIPMPGSMMFRHPDQYQIEICAKAAYEDVLAWDLALFKAGKNPISYNNMMRVYHYRDKDQRDFNQVAEDTVERIRKTKKLLDGKLMQEIMQYVQNGILRMSDLQGIQRI